ARHAASGALPDVHLLSGLPRSRQHRGCQTADAKGSELQRCGYRLWRWHILSWLSAAGYSGEPDRGTLECPEVDCPHHGLLGNRRDPDGLSGHAAIRLGATRQSVIWLAAVAWYRGGGLLSRCHRLSFALVS